MPMAGKMLKRYGLEGVAKTLIAIGLLLLLFSWLAGVYYFGPGAKITLLTVPFIFTCIY